MDLEAAPSHVGAVRKNSNAGYGFNPNNEKNPMDDRKKQIVLTEKAYNAEQVIHSRLLIQQKHLCQEIPEQRLRWLEKDLNQMLCNLKKEMEQEATI